MCRYDISRFERAYQLYFDIALREIKSGYKTSHWMWFMFPQLTYLGSTEISHYFGMESLDEAREFLNNSYLRKHLIKLCKRVLKLDDVYFTFGEIDAQKLWASMTLFSIADPKTTIFSEVLGKFFGGKLHFTTMDFLHRLSMH